MAAKRKRKHKRGKQQAATRTTPSGSPRKLLILIATAFLANVCIMSLELVAGRLVARFIGQSLYTWTTIVGAVLLGMSIGSYLGGRLADRFPPMKLLAVLLLLAGAACPLVLALNHVMGNILFVRGFAWPPRIFAHVMVTFLVPCIFLGSVTPVILREALTVSVGTGRIIGLVYGASALGSVIGTFVAGFALIPNIGTRMIVLLLGTGLGSLAVYYAWASQRKAPAESALLPESKPVYVDQPSYRLSPKVLGALVAVFIGNASFMIYELAAARLATEYLGHTIYTWTSLLGIVLAGIMLGNYLGGRLSDRVEPDVLLPRFFAASAILALFSLPLYRWLAESYALDNLVWSTRIVTQIGLAFFVPSVAMGMIGPAAARKAITLADLPGRTVGLVYATGSFASVVATFATGYFLVDHLWPIGTILLLCTTLAAAAVIWGPRSRVAWAAVPVMAAGLAVAMLPATASLAQRLGLRAQDGPEYLYRDHSQYSWIAVTASPLNKSERQLYLDQLLHSSADLDAPLTLEYEYEQIYNGVLNAYYPEPQPIRANILGGGGYVYPRYLELARPGSYIETVEIDPAVTEAARAAFGLPRDTSIAIYEMDARNRIEDLVREGEMKFDCIFGDSFNQYSVPFQLTTVEFTQHIHDLLDDDGLYFMNLIESMKRGAFLGSMIRTMRVVFPHVYSIRTDNPESIRDTFVVLGSKRPLDIESVMETMRSEGFQGGLLTDREIGELIARNDSPVLTDDFAPVDNMVGPLINTRESSRTTQMRQDVLEHIKNEEIDEAIELLLTLHELEPWDIDVVRNLALMYGQRNELDKAEPFFVRAVEMAPNDPEFQYNLGLLYSQTGRDDLALEQFQAAYELRPDYTAAAFALGSVLNAAGRYDEAVAPLQAATELDPNNVSGHMLLANTLATLKRFEEAKDQFETALDLSPDFPGVRENLARVHLNLHEFGDARAHYMKLLEKEPRNAVYLYLFGVTLESEGKPGEAVPYYRLAIEIDPSFTDAREALERAERASQSVEIDAP